MTCVRLNCSERRKRIVASTFLLFIVLITIVVVGYYYTSLNIKQSQSRQVDTTVDLKFEEIKSYIQELYVASQTNATKVGENIQSNIFKEYGTKDKLVHLSNDFDNDNYDDIYPIVEKAAENKYLNGVNNQRNSIFVATNKAILFDMNYESSSDNESKNHSDWKTFEESNANRLLAKNAVYSLTHIPNDLVFIEPTESNIKDHPYESIITIDRLKEIYKKEGIEGLKNYQLLVPYYIKDYNTDIFNNKEISHGVHHMTYRIMVVQRCNIYDQIINNNPELVDTSVEEIISYNDTVEMYINLILFLMIVIFIVSILLVGFVFNEYIIFNNAICNKKDDKSSNKAD